MRAIRAAAFLILIAVLRFAHSSIRVMFWREHYRGLCNSIRAAARKELSLGAASTTAS